MERGTVVFTDTWNGGNYTPFESHVYGSDHKPVRATFTCSIRVINSLKEYEICKAMRKDVKSSQRRRSSRASTTSSLSVNSEEPNQVSRNRSKNTVCVCLIITSVFY